MLLTNLKIRDPQFPALDAGIDAILIEHGKIVAVGPKPDFLRSGDTRDMAGLFVTPGLIDAHIHLCLDHEISDPMEQDKADRETLLQRMADRAARMLQAGITTARDLGGGQWLELAVRDAINRGEIPGPRLLCAGQPITSVRGHCHFWGGEATGANEAIEVLLRQLEHGVDLIKVMATGGNLTKGSTPMNAQFDLEELTSIVSEASKRGFPVAAHCHGTAGIDNAARAGVSTIEHCSWVGANGWAKHYDPDVAASIVRQGVYVSPTVNLGWKRRIGSGDYENLVRGNFSKLRQAGARFIASTDAGIPGVRHQDLALALPVFGHFAGLDNAEVLLAATSQCAKAIGLGNVTGQIHAGLAADLLFLEKDPLLHLDALAAPVAVMARGQWVGGLSVGNAS